jgi:Concanavalin A-like lectin/glucanases superfamily/Metallo-peptidase family M12
MSLAAPSLRHFFASTALATLFACAPAGDHAQAKNQANSDAWQSIAVERWGAESFETLELELPQEVAASLAEGKVPMQAPRSLRIPLTIDGYPTSLELQQYSMRSTEFAAQTWDTERGYAPAEGLHAPAAPLTYRGSAAGMPDLTVLGAITSRGFRALIIPTLGEPLRLMSAREVDEHAAATTYLLGAAQNLDAVDLICEANEADFADELEQPGSQHNHGSNASPPGGGMTPPVQPDCVSRGHIAFDCDFQYYQAFGSSVANTIARAESHLNEVDYHYARDVRITMPMSHIIVRTTQFYFPIDGGDLLNLFRNEWNTNLGHIDRDLAHMLTNKSGIQYGGLAWVGTVCTSLAYAWSLDSAGIVSHEIGHNWGSGHCHDGSPCNNMCGACLYIAPITRGIIDNFRNSRWCLDEVPYRSPVPPYTSVPDTAIFLASELLDGPVLIDPLANDEDGNCDPIQLTQLDGATARGVSLQTLQGPQPDGRDRVIYDASNSPVVGLDSFSYLGASKDGLAAGLEVSILINPVRQLQGWPLDEGSGSTSVDRFDPLKVAQINGASWTTGITGSALAFDGVDDYVSIPAANVSSKHLTVTMWLKRDGNASFFPGLLMARGPGVESGLNLGTHGELRYTWADSLGSRTFDSGLEAPIGQWVLAAMVVEPDQTTLYMGNSNGLLEATHREAHAAESFFSEFHLGHDPNYPNDRYYQGAIDEVRVFHEALSRSQIARIAQLGGRAEAPLPADGTAGSDTLRLVSWAADPNALSHNVYLGTDYWTVALADTSDAEFLGNTAGENFALPPLQSDLRYYWRVDSLFPDVEAGRVWQFEVPPSHHWPMDETFGDRVVDIGAGLDGRAWNGVQLNQPGATAKTGTSFRFDGNNDRIEMPALNLYQDRMTISGWARRSGGQDNFTGLVYCRAGGTVAGLHLGDSNDLRYTWNGDAATFNWSSGIKLPNDEWVFVALVVEPGQATIYRGRNGAITSSVNSVAHAAEEWNGPWMIGRDPAAGRVFNGWLDDMRVWRSALSATEVQAIYDATR